MLKLATDNKRADIQGLMLIFSILASILLLFICSVTGTFAAKLENNDNSDLLRIIATATDNPAIRQTQRQEKQTAKSYSRLFSSKTINNTKVSERFIANDTALNSVTAALFSLANYQITGRYVLSHQKPFELTAKQARDPPSV